MCLPTIQFYRFLATSAITMLSSIGLAFYRVAGRFQGVGLFPGSVLQRPAESRIPGRIDGWNISHGI